MKFLLLAAFVALSTASAVFPSKTITVGEDGNILISTLFGKTVRITRPVTGNGQKEIDIWVSGPNFPNKRIQINEEYPASFDTTLNNEGSRFTRGSYSNQGEVLYEILKQYQGVVDEPLYQQLLVQVNQAVQKGEISHQIYDLLVALDQIDDSYFAGLNQVVPQNLGQLVAGQYGVQSTLPWFRRYLSGVQSGISVQNSGYYGQYLPSYYNPSLLGNNYVQQLAGQVVPQLGYQNTQNIWSRGQPSLWNYLIGRQVPLQGQVGIPFQNQGILQTLQSLGYLQNQVSGISGLQSQIQSQYGVPLVSQIVAELQGQIPLGYQGQQIQGYPLGINQQLSSAIQRQGQTGMPSYIQGRYGVPLQQGQSYLNQPFYQGLYLFEII